MVKTFAQIFRNSPFASLVDRRQVLTARGNALANGEFGGKHSVKEAGKTVRFKKFDYAMTHQAEVERVPSSAARFASWPLLFGKASDSASLEAVQRVAKNAFAHDAAYEKTTAEGVAPKGYYKLPLVTIPKSKWGQYAISKDVHPSWSQFWTMYTSAVASARRKGTSSACAVGLDEKIQPLSRRHPGIFVGVDVPEKTYVMGRYLNTFGSGSAAAVGIEGFVGELQELPVNARLPSRGGWHAFEVGRAYIDANGRPVVLLKRQVKGYIAKQQQ